jgi:hypothetical protein
MGPDPAVSKAVRRPALRRLPFLAMAAVALLAGLWAGLLRLGLDLPTLRPELAADHGILLVLGFLGTQIGLERAVALGRGWTYLAPAAAGAGALWLLVGLPQEAGQAILVFGGAVLVLVFVEVHRIQPSWHNLVMGLGAAAWLVGAAIWLADGTMTTVVPWLAAFLVLTIVGERLELSRMGRPPRSAIALLLGVVAVFLAGLVVATAGAGDLGIRLAGIGLFGQAVWLARYDVARRTIRVAGATRYMAAALIAGYFWLAVAGIAWIAGGALTGGGFEYDAMVHTIFLGFVFSMIFAHAAIIVPAVLEVPLPWRPGFYLPLALLHLGLAVRVIGDLAESTTAWRLGGIVDEAAILLFLAMAVVSSVRAGWSARST